MWEVIISDPRGVSMIIDIDDEIFSCQLQLFAVTYKGLCPHCGSMVSESIYTNSKIFETKCPRCGEPIRLKPVGYDHLTIATVRDVLISVKKLADVDALKIDYSEGGRECLKM